MSGSGIHQNVPGAVQVATKSFDGQEDIENLFNNMNGDATGTMNRNPKPENIILESCEGTEFEVPVAVIEQSGLVKSVYSDGFSNRVPLPAVTAPVVELMISFWTEQTEFNKFTKRREYEVMHWEKFFDKMNRKLLFDFVDAKEMLDRTCTYIATIMKDMSVEDVREFFGVVNDFSPEEGQVSEENMQALD